jgi:hypothetical protein
MLQFEAIVHIDHVGFLSLFADQMCAAPARKTTAALDGRRGQILDSALSVSINLK